MVNTRLMGCSIENGGILITESYSRKKKTEWGYGIEKYGISRGN